MRRGWWWGQGSCLKFQHAKAGWFDWFFTYISRLYDEFSDSGFSLRLLFTLPYSVLWVWRIKVYWIMLKVCWKKLLMWGRMRSEKLHTSSKGWTGDTFLKTGQTWLIFVVYFTLSQKILNISLARNKVTDTVRDRHTTADAWVLSKRWRHTLSSSAISSPTNSRARRCWSVTRLSPP